MSSDRRPTVTFAVPTREGAAAKAIRLAAMGRVRIQVLHRGRCVALVLGDTGSHRVAHVHGRWHCDCEAKGLCSHLLAVRGCVDVTGSDTP